MVGKYVVFRKPTFDIPTSNIDNNQLSMFDSSSLGEVSKINPSMVKMYVTVPLFMAKKKEPRLTKPIGSVFAGSFYHENSHSIPMLVYQKS